MRRTALIRFVLFAIGAGIALVWPHHLILVVAAGFVLAIVGAIGDRLHRAWKDYQYYKRFPGERPNRRAP
jgi:hypothetical protein